MSHTTSAPGLYLVMSTRPASSFQWRWVSSIPLDFFTFSFVYVTEHEQILWSEMTFGFKPKKTPIFVDLGYHVYFANKPLYVVHRSEVGLLQTIRHGAVLRIGYAKF